MFGCCCALWPVISSLVWSVQKRLLQKSCGFFMLFAQIQLCKPRLCFHALSFNMLSDACTVWDVALGFFAVCVSSAQSDLELDLLDYLLLGRLWHCVNTHLDAPDQKTARTSGFIEVLNQATDQLMKYIWLSPPGCYSLLSSYPYVTLNSYGSSKCVLAFSEETVNNVQLLGNLKWEWELTHFWSRPLLAIFRNCSFLSLTC